MAGNTYRVVEVVGTSTQDLTDAIRNGVAYTARTTEHVDWFEVTQIRGHIEDNQIAHYQVELKVGFRVAD